MRGARCQPLDKPPFPLTSAVYDNEKEAAAVTQKIDPEKARQGEKTGIVRYILATSLALAVIAVAAVGFGVGA